MQQTAEEFLKLIQGKRFRRADAYELIYKFIAIQDCLVKRYIFILKSP